MKKRRLAQTILIGIRRETNALLKDPGVCPRKYSVSPAVYQAISEDVELHYDERKKRPNAFLFGIPLVVDRRLKDFQVVI